MSSKRKTTPFKILTQAKVNRAIELRIEGWTLDAIAKELGWGDRASAHMAITRALAERRNDNLDALRDMEGNRLDALWRHNWPGVIKGNTRAIEVAIRIIERRARLFGLDAPERKVIEFVQHYEEFRKIVFLVLDKLPLEIQEQFHAQLRNVAGVSEDQSSSQGLLG